MREYGKLPPAFWTGPVARRLREGDSTEALMVAVYLATAPSSTMTGLYYLPLPTMAHETGLTLEGASKALQRVSEAEFAHYDEEHEVVWVPVLAEWQVGPELKPNDNRVKGVRSAIAPYRHTRYFSAFLERYGQPYHLSTGSPSEAPPKQGEGEGEGEGEGSNKQLSRTSGDATGGSAPEKPKRNPKPKTPPSADATRLAEALRLGILSEQPDHRLSRVSGWTPAVRDSWARELDRMLGIDKRPSGAADEQLRWLFGDQGGSEARFVVQSAKAWREKWDRIAAAMARPARLARGSSSPCNGVGGLSAAEILEMARRDAEAGR